MSNRPKATLTEGHIGRHLVKLSLPLSWAIMMSMASNFFDVFFVAKLGTNQLAALGFSFPVILFLASMSFGLSNGVVSVASRALGANRRIRSQRLMRSALILGGLLGLAVCAIGQLLLVPTFTLLGAQPEVLPYIESYMRIWFCSFPFFIIVIVSQSCLRVVGNTTTPSRIMTLSAAIHGCLCPLLVFGYSFMPSLGIQGAAIAGFITQSITSVIILVLVNRYGLLSRKFGRSRIVILWRDLLKIAIPAMGTSMLGNSINIILATILAQFGPAVMAAFAVLSRVEAIVFIMMIATSLSLSPIVGQNWGANLKLRAMQAGRLAVIGTFILGFIFAIVLAFWGEQFGMFFNKDPEVIAVMLLYLVFVPFSYPARACTNYFASVNNAVGKPLRGTAAMASQVSIQAGLALVGAAFFGPVGVFAAKFTTNWLVGITTLTLGDVTGKLWQKGRFVPLQPNKF